MRHRPARPSLLLWAPLLLCLVPCVRAETLLVDAAGAPDSDHKTIQAAVDAAQPGDVLLVRAGVYDPFVLDKPLSVVAETIGPEGHVIVLGTLVVHGLLPGEVAALGSLTIEFLRVDACQGTLFADVLSVSSPNASQGPGDVASIVVLDSADVRFRQLGQNPGVGSGRDGLHVLRSQVESDGMAIDGARGRPGATGAPEGGPGGVGVLVGDGGVLRFHNGRARGGRGGDALFSTSQAWAGGDGGAAVRVLDGGRLDLNGTIHTQVYGGWAGNGSLLHGGSANCALEGLPGAGVVVDDGGQARLAAAVVVEGGFASCGADGPVTAGPGPLELVAPADLNLHWQGGIPQIGLGPSLEVYELPGSLTALLVGVEPLLLSIPKWQGHPLRVAPLVVTPVLVVPGSGGLNIPVLLPPDLPLGLPIVVQAGSQRPDGSFFLSNSTTAVVIPPQEPPCEPGPCNPDE